MKTLRLLAASVLALGVANVYAGTAVDTFNVTADVVGNCLVSTTDLAFGNYDPIDVNSSTGADKDASSTITTTCTLGHGISINIDDGSYVGQTAYTRNMNFDDAGTQYYLGYQLYRNAYATAWTSAADLAAAGTGTAVNTTVEGRIPKGQDATTLKASTGGSYQDVLTVTVTF